MVRLSPLVMLVVVVAVLPDPSHPAAPTEPVWTYADQDGWSQVSNLCVGQSQSPIQLAADKHNRLPWSRCGRRPKLRFTEDLKRGQVKAYNSGRTLDFNLESKSGDPIVELEGRECCLLDGVYVLDGMHAHWNDPDGGRGSEHQLGEDFQEAEVHFVFYKNEYGNVSAALSHSDGLVVLGLLLRPDDDLEGGLKLPSFGLGDDLSHLAAIGSEVNHEADLRSLRPLLDTALKNVFSYSGSLTTPPCSQVVTWIVADRPFIIDANFLQELRTSLNADLAGTRKIQRNYRELQRLGDRAIYKYFSPSSKH